MNRSSTSIHVNKFDLLHIFSDSFHIDASGSKGALLQNVTANALLVAEINSQPACTKITINEIIKERMTMCKIFLYKHNFR